MWLTYLSLHCGRPITHAWPETSIHLYYHAVWAAVAWGYEQTQPLTPTRTWTGPETRLRRVWAFLLFRAVAHDLLSTDHIFLSTLLVSYTFRKMIRYRWKIYFKSLPGVLIHTWYNTSIPTSPTHPPHRPSYRGNYSRSLCSFCIVRSVRPPALSIARSVDHAVARPQWKTGVLV